ncbi:MAG: phage holin family protein [Anaerolineaceae bacterium]|nr:phage holin family protein [Anaerolineaceae bacterium]
MRNFAIRVIINAVAIAITASLLNGVHVANNDIGTLLIIGVVFGVVNAIIRPILIFLTCPAVIVSLGLFLLVINGLMLMLTASLIPARLQIDGFGWAVLAGIVMGILGMIMESILKPEDKDKDKRKRNPNVITIDRH